MRVDLEDVFAMATLAEICPEQIVELVFADGAVAAVRGPRSDGGVVAAAALRHAAQCHQAGVDEVAWFGLVDHFTVVRLVCNDAAQSPRLDEIALWAVGACLVEELVLECRRTEHQRRDR